MGKTPNDVVITGIGIVSCHGVGREIHEELLASPSSPKLVIDTERFAPYPVHPLPEIDWSEQIARRGDQRQMENWQRLGVFTAGLALDDAGLKENEEACSTMDMIVAASGGERDVAVDTLIVNEAAKRNDRDIVLNEKLTTELRPTLFLAQLSNLLAGNISIVHKVTGSSKTFMGEEAAGISALSTAFERIRAGQSTHVLVGGAYNAERQDMQTLYEGVQSLSQGEWQPVWSREGPGGGIVTGSAAAFLVLESRAHAEARGARIYAMLQAVEGDRGGREADAIGERLKTMADRCGVADQADSLILSGTSGRYELRDIEREFVDGTWPTAGLRGYSGVIGHTLEAQFPVGVALAALALKSGAAPAAFDPDHETAMNGTVRTALVTTIGFIHGEGMAALRSEEADKVEN
ncbi:beta-ketoacyl-ACP synthase [Hoeflea prorocentri]|uniref:Beta-ketoacyl-ACP synthase n=1 Tax=Hoeflea prorocentri TaxID=1922333 RepID=A0A9X3UIP3_9HYPH|nr:beta-ketoacyl-ACP synthase [Hoeflea prorocentri]MCY6381367.1 beta-ketoacyl-ACP synthase [Hoeflea prorocentri]MDA5399167.1 beta-ketoacyl-ACP synthase [Hoeflea prorocentri]